MAWTSPRTWVVGEVVTAALMNTHVRDDLLALYPDLATSLPGSPYNDKFATLTDSLTAPTYTWTFRYISAKASNKWQYVGGTHLASVKQTLSQANITTYRYTSTLITVPRTGLYDVTLQARDTVGGGANALYTVGVNGAADDTYAVQGIAAFYYTARRSFTAADALSIAYRVRTGSIAATATDIEMRLVPVEVT